MRRAVLVFLSVMLVLTVAACAGEGPRMRLDYAIHVNADGQGWLGTSMRFPFAGLAPDDCRRMATPRSGMDQPGWDLRVESRPEGSDCVATSVMRFDSPATLSRQMLVLAPENEGPSPESPVSLRPRLQEMDGVMLITLAVELRPAGSYPTDVRFTVAHPHLVAASATHRRPSDVPGVVHYAFPSSAPGSYQAAVMLRGPGTLQGPAGGAGADQLTGGIGTDRLVQTGAVAPKPGTPTAQPQPPTEKRVACLSDRVTIVGTGLSETAFASAFTSACTLLKAMYNDGQANPLRLSRPIDVYIIPRGMKLTDLQPFSNHKGRQHPETGQLYDELPGIGPDCSDGVTPCPMSVAETNLTPQSVLEGGYPAQYVLAHEFGHAVFRFGLNSEQGMFHGAHFITRSKQYAIPRGWKYDQKTGDPVLDCQTNDRWLCSGSQIQTNANEYFAEAWAAYWNRPYGGGTAAAGMYTRSWLKQHDCEMYQLIDSLYTGVVNSCP